MSSIPTATVKADDAKVLASYEEHGSYNSTTTERGKRILFVDDEEQVRVLGHALLEHLGYEVVLAADGLEALEIYQYEEIDLVITDIRMPKMSGAELFHSIQEVDPNAIVILCSGYDMAHEVGMALDAGAYGFLSKPFSINDLGAMIADALDIEGLMPVHL